MKRTVPVGKGLSTLLYVVISPIVIAFILCVFLGAPFLVNLILLVVSGLLYLMVKSIVKQSAKMNLVEIYDTKVSIATQIGKISESFDYSEIKDFKLVEDDGLFKNGIYVIFTDEALEWRLSSTANRAMKNTYKKFGTIAVIPAYLSSVPIENVYSILKKQLEAYQSTHNALTQVDDNDEDDDSVTDFIDDVDDILDAVEEGYAEGERIAIRISKILKL